MVEEAELAEYSPSIKRLQEEIKVGHIALEDRLEACCTSHSSLQYIDSIHLAASDVCIESTIQDSKKTHHPLAYVDSSTSSTSDTGSVQVALTDRP